MVRNYKEPEEIEFILIVKSKLLYEFVKGNRKKFTKTKRNN